MDIHRSCGTVWLALTAATLFASPAHADADAFIAALDSHGIAYTSRQLAIDTGHRVCAGLLYGQTPEQIAVDIMQNSGLTAYSSGFVVGASIRAFCPR